jgi:hypothetical protein
MSNKRTPAHDVWAVQWGTKGFSSILGAGQWGPF